MASTFRCRLITPESQVLDEAATSAVVPCWDGQLGVLPNRAAMVMELGTGELRIDFGNQGAPKGGSRSFFVSDGFVQMLNNSLTILAVNAVGAEKLSEADAQKELDAVLAKKTDDLTGADMDKHQKAIARAKAKLAAAKTFKGKGGF